MNFQTVIPDLNACYQNNNGYCFNHCESEVCYSLCNHTALLGHVGRWLFCDLTCFVLLLSKLR